MKQLQRSQQLVLLSCLLFLPSAGWSLTAAQAYAAASLAAVNYVPPSAPGTGAAYMPGVPLCLPGGSSGAGGCSSSTPAPSIVSGAVDDIFSAATNLTVTVAPVTINGTPCDTCAGSLAWDNSTGAGILTVAPTTPPILVPDTIVHEDTHYVSHNYDGYLNFNVSGYNSGTPIYGSSFNASEPLAFAMENAMLPSAFLYAAQAGNVADFSTLVTGYDSNKGNFAGTFAATNQAVNDFNSSLNTSGVVGQLLNDSNGVSAIATLPNGNYLSLSSNVANSSSRISLYDSNGNIIGSLDFERASDMSTVAGRSQLVNYVLDKLSGATTLLASLNPSNSTNQAISAQNAQIISQGEQIIANPTGPASTCNIVCQGQNVHNITKGTNPVAVMNSLVSAGKTSANTMKTIMPVRRLQTITQ